jgi:hypothetical protein
LCLDSPFYIVNDQKETGTTAKHLAERAAMETELERLFICKEGENNAQAEYESGREVAIENCVSISEFGYV